MKKKVSLLRKKNGLFNQATLSLHQEMLDSLEVFPEDKDISLFYSKEEGKIELIKGKKEEKEEKDRNGNLISFQGNRKVIFSGSKKQASARIAKLSIPFLVLKSMGLTENPYLSIYCEPGKVIMKGVSMGKIYTVKVNKGGIGKTFTAVQVGHGLALNGYKVLLLTSDSQNNILHYTLSKEMFSKLPEKYDMAKGLRHAVLFGDKEDYYIKLRKNLYCLPAESSVFTKKFEQEFPMYLEKKKEEYDYILIDSIPTMDIDKVFVECSDYVILPTFCDFPTFHGTQNVLQTGIEKVHSILVNKYKPTKIQKEFLEQLQKMLEETDIVFPKPIRELAQIENLLQKGKTIWETQAKNMDDCKNSFLDILEAMI
ncbi:ParA family protein [Fusobacterium necrophorum]|uniref:ParA family protein n=1 Tax=Fusobacterium necrophorum TaxID=859 RepID=A0A4Q2KSY1_9FUSO|nr:ParA family protein [Fusobacterium necrophorum]RXZ68588.1 ParA family protein [Fusobacterium necrophorum]